MIFANLSSRLASTPQSDGSSCRGRALISNKCTSEKEDKLYSIHVPSRYFKYMYTCIYQLTVKRTKYFWLFSPTQLLTQGQWWSILRMHRRQTLKHAHKHACERLNTLYCNLWAVVWPPAVVGALGLDADTLGALQNDLTLLQVQLGDVLFRGVSSWDGSLKKWKIRRLYMKKWM